MNRNYFIVIPTNAAIALFAFDGRSSASASVLASCSPTSADENAEAICPISTAQSYDSCRGRQLPDVNRRRWLMNSAIAAIIWSFIKKACHRIFRVRDVIPSVFTNTNGTPVTLHIAPAGSGIFSTLTEGSTFYLMRWEHRSGVLGAGRLESPHLPPVPLAWFEIRVVHARGTRGTGVLEVSVKYLTGRRVRRRLVPARG